jgi:hypothetical protein
MSTVTYRRILISGRLSKSPNNKLQAIKAV